MSVLIRYVYALQYEDVERAGVILDKAVCGQRLSC